MSIQPGTALVERLRNRVHDSPMHAEHLMDEAGDLIEALVDACETNRIALIAIADSALEAGFDQLADIIDEQLGKTNSSLSKARGEGA